jgi:Lon protease-like protein
MVAHCLAGEGYLAIALLKPGYEKDYEGRPPVHPVMGAGAIVAHERLPDGCYQILVEGRERVRCVAEAAPTRSFRMVRAERLVDTSDAETTHADETLRGLLRELARANPKQAAMLAQVLALGREPGQLADCAAATTVANVEVRQEILAELSLTKRLRRVTEELGRMFLETPPGGLAS